MSGSKKLQNRLKIYLGNEMMVDRSLPLTEASSRSEGHSMPIDANLTVAEQCLPENLTENEYATKTTMELLFDYYNVFGKYISIPYITKTLSEEMINQINAKSLLHYHKQMFTVWWLLFYEEEEFSFTYLSDKAITLARFEDANTAKQYDDDVCRVLTEIKKRNILDGTLKIFWTMLWKGNTSRHTFISFDEMLLYQKAFAKRICYICNALFTSERGVKQHMASPKHLLSHLLDAFFDEDENI